MITMITRSTESQQLLSRFPPALTDPHPYRVMPGIVCAYLPRLLWWRTTQKLLKEPSVFPALDPVDPSQVPALPPRIIWRSSGAISKYPSRRPLPIIDGRGLLDHMSQPEGGIGDAHSNGRETGRLPA